MKIYLATDHAGFQLKEDIKLFLEVNKDDLLIEMTKKGRVIQDIEIIDFGAYEYDESDDYPKYISMAAGALSSDIYIGKDENLAIIFGGSGQGEAMVADKYKGIRAGVINNENIELVKLLREHNNANILSFGARFISFDFAKEAVNTFLLTKFIDKENGENSRHKRRVAEIEDFNQSEISLSKESLEELNSLENDKINLSVN